MLDFSTPHATKHHTFICRYRLRKLAEPITVFKPFRRPEGIFATGCGLRFFAKRFGAGIAHCLIIADWFVYFHLGSHLHGNGGIAAMAVLKAFRRPEGSFCRKPRPKIFAKRPGAGIVFRLLSLPLRYCTLA
ncbi:MULTISPECIES: hypothetical protein [unclassified Neisseria]|uniref:hypothetical protein n=1 Tax=unclassified Neisseria TaxID=2623750 RepID=UPI001071DA9E|nr:MULTISPECIES: hypothetical protein [unclassified Neisseria]MBF0803530.1 hypothetical protein [Neisseria sp. 19428wB4_WF04]